MRIYIPAKTIKELRALAHLVADEADASQYSSAVNVCGKDGRWGWDVRSSGFGPAALKELGLEEQWATDAGF